MSEINQVPDNLLLFPSSRIVSCRDGNLRISEEILLKVINSSRASHSTKGDDASPVTILSILGEPSNEKYLLTKAFMEYSEKSEGVRSGSVITILPNDALTTTTGIRSDDELSSSGVHLINQPIPLRVQSDDGEKQLLVWMLYLCQSESGTESDLKLLRQFVLLASSRIAEVKFEQEQFQLLREWMELEAKLGKPLLICQSFLYVFPSEQIPSDQAPILSGSQDFLRKLSAKMQTNSGDNSKDSDGVSVITKLGEVNIIEMSKLSDSWNPNSENGSGEMSPIYKGLVDSIRELNLHQDPKFIEKVTLDGPELRHGKFSQFLKDCVAFVNDFNSTDEGEKSDGRNGIKQKSATLSPPMTLDADADPESLNKISSRLRENGNLSQEKDEGRQTVQRYSPEETPKSYETKSPIQNDNERQLASKMLPKIVDFYREQMTRFLKEDIYHPKTMHWIDTTLRSKLLGDFKKIVKLEESQKKAFGDELMATFDKLIPQYREQNTANLKKVQGLISKCQTKLVSSFMEQIEMELNGNPKGLKGPQLTQKRDKIINELKTKFASEVKEKVREKEPLEEHLISLTSEMDEYWEGVEERNDQILDQNPVAAKGSKGGGWKGKLKRTFSGRK